MGRVLTLRQCADNAIRRLLSEYPDGEARWMVRIIFEKLKGWNRTEMMIRADQEISPYIAGKVDEITRRLLDHEPIQYILGEARFFGLTLNVTPDVLIPRPETEELVDMIVADAHGRSDLRVMDLCTGSGCIAIALARNLPFAQVTAVDISAKALEVAAGNATLTKTAIHFRNADVLSLPRPEKADMDIIVSNPPYIAESERAAMDPNVLDHEPSLALFVPDSDPLKFYRAISSYSRLALRPGGRLYFEINPLFAPQLRSMLEADGWTEITVTSDMQRKQRFISATAPAE